MITTPPPSGPHRGLYLVVGWWLRGWPAICHLSLDLLAAGCYLTLVLLLIAAVALIPVLGIGLPLLVLVLAGAVAAARLDLLRLEAVTGVRLSAVTMRGPDAGPWWRRLVLGAPAWRSMAWVAVQSLWGLVGGCLALCCSAVTLALVSAPLYVHLLPSSSMTWPWGTSTSGPWWLLLVFGIGVVASMLTPLLATGLVTVNVLLARLLLTAGRTPQQVADLNQRVQTLTRSRAATVDSVEAERRRIERDLHDGPQQRLVAIAMDLGLARERLSRDLDGARELIDRAHGSAKAAVVEMRQVARGIHPPILTDRGLDAALSALAAGSPVPVDVRVEVPRRPSATIEAIAYFCVSEALTNVAKHARAGRAKVRVRSVDQVWLRVEIQDDGVGGADPDTGGTGLRGLADRVAAVDGAVHLASPPGGPTVLTVHLPFTEPAVPPSADPTAEPIAEPTSPLPAEPTAPLLGPPTTEPTGDAGRVPPAESEPGSPS